MLSFHSGVGVPPFAGRTHFTPGPPPPSAPHGLLRDSAPQISTRAFDPALTDSITQVNDSTASLPAPTPGPSHPPPRPDLAPPPAPIANALPRRSARRKLRARIQRGAAERETYALFGDACFEAVHSIFPELPGAHMCAVKEALSFCVPRWMALVSHGEERTAATSYQEYEYYSAYEEEEQEDEAAPG